MFQKLFNDNPELPNKFSVAMGEQIRIARQENNMSQEQLAKAIYKRRASLSEIENGKMEPSASTLLLLSYALNKPVSYFFPRNQGIVALNEEDLTTEEQELIFLTRRLISSSDEEEVHKLIAQVRVLAVLAENKVDEEMQKLIDKELDK